MNILKSNKFRASLMAAMTAVAGALTGQVEWSHAVAAVIGCLLVYVAFQGVADHGKEAEKVRAEVERERRVATDGMTPAERARAVDAVE